MTDINELDAYEYEDRFGAQDAYLEAQYEDRFEDDLMNWENEQVFQDEMLEREDFGFFGDEAFCGE